MKIVSPALLGLSLAFVGSALTAAQEMQGPPKVLTITREFTKPGKGGDMHDKSESKFVSAMAAAKWPTHYFALSSLSGKSRALYLTGYPSFKAWEDDFLAMMKNKPFSAELDKDAVADGELLEWAEVHGNFYGTPREPVERSLAQGRDVLFDIDYQGTQQLKTKAGEDVVTIFILPPSMQELQARLERRAEDAGEAIAKRLANARNEIARWTLYDYVLVNDDIQRTFDNLVAILTAERLCAPRQKQGIEDFVERLMKED